MEAASIRYKNPGAMWGNALAIKWGASKKAVTLNDGKGQGNNIAVFPTFVQGICAQMDLWRTSKNYKNKRFADAVAVWSGHNSVPQYIAFVKKHAPGITEDTVMNDAFWRGPLAIPFLKAQAWHEAGKEYPAPAADWVEAQKRVLKGVSTPVKTATAVVVSTIPVVVASAHSGLSLSTALIIGLGVGLTVGLYFLFKHLLEANAWNSTNTALPSLPASQLSEVSSISPLPSSGSSLTTNEQIQERVGSVSNPEPVLRDVTGQDTSPVHPEGS